MNNHPILPAQTPQLGHAAYYAAGVPFYMNIPRDGYSLPPKKTNKPKKKRTK